MCSTHVRAIAIDDRRRKLMIDPSDQIPIQSDVAHPLCCTGGSTPPLPGHSALLAFEKGIFLGTVPETMSKEIGKVRS